MMKGGANMKTLIDKDRYKEILQQAIRMVTVRPDCDLMCKDELDNMRLAYEDAMACLERMPDALIRCKDCKYCDQESTWWCEHPNAFRTEDCGGVIIGNHDNGCLLGERKEGEQDEG